MQHATVSSCQPKKYRRGKIRKNKQFEKCYKKEGEVFALFYSKYCSQNNCGLIAVVLFTTHNSLVLGLAPDGKIWHPRMVKKKGYTVCHGVKRKVWTPEQCKKIICEGKHRYLMPLDKKMKKQIEPLRKPYPKKQGAIDGGSQE